MRTAFVMDRVALANGSAKSRRPDRTSRQNSDMPLLMNQAENQGIAGLGGTIQRAAGATGVGFSTFRLIGASWLWFFPYRK